MASTRLAEVFSPGGKGARNSLLLYFAMINLSLSSCEEVGSGLGPFSFCSQILFAIELPKADITAKWPGGHSSRSSERTLDMCEPNFRWTPEHSMQISTPRLMLAQSGFGRSQSTHRLFPEISDFRVLIACKSIIEVLCPLLPLLGSHRCNELRICCSIACTHSSLSSTEAASKCHCLLSRETMWNSNCSCSLSIPSTLTPFDFILR